MPMESLLGIKPLWFLSVLVLSIVLPLIPAVLIYLLFPATHLQLVLPNWASTAIGPLKNASLKASGAIGAYLAILLLVQPQVSRIYDYLESDLVPVWKVHARLQMMDQHNLEVDSGTRVLLADQLQVQVIPPNYWVSQDWITFSIPATTVKDIPDISLRLSEPYFVGGISVSKLDSSVLSVDALNHVVSINEPVVLQEYVRRHGQSQ